MRKPNPVAPNITQFEEKLIVAKLDLMKSAGKRLLSNKSEFVQSKPQLEASRQSGSPKELITTQMARQKEDFIHAADILARKQRL